MAVLSLVDALIPSLTWFNVYGQPLSCYSHGELSMRGARSLLAEILGWPEEQDDTDPTPFILNQLAHVLPRNSDADSQLQSIEPFFLLIQCCIFFSSNNLLGLQGMDQFVTWIFETGSVSLFNQYISRLKRVASPTLELFLNRLLLSGVSLEKEALVSSLLGYEIDPNFNNFYIDQDGREAATFIDQTITPLQLAVIRGNDHVSRLLVQHGAEVDAVSFRMSPCPLELAISVNHGHFSIAEMLLASGANIDRSCKLEVIGVQDDNESLSWKLTERTLLMKAIEVQNIDLTRLLLSHGAAVNDVSCVSGTALQIATLKNDMDLLQILLQAGAKVNIAGELEMASRRLIEYQLDKWFPNTEDARELDDAYPWHLHLSVLWATFSLPIQIATRKNQMSLVQCLLDAGAIVNDSRDWDKTWARVSVPTHVKRVDIYERVVREWREWFQSPLHHSAKNGNIQLTRLLLNHGAAVDSRNAAGATPLQLACGLDRDDFDQKHNDLVIPAEQNGTNLARLLLAWGADVNAPPGPVYGRTALQAAAENGDEELVQLLLSFGADTNAPSSAQGGLTVPQAASRAGNFSLINILLNHSVAFTAETFWVALYVAASTGNLPTVEQFLDRGIDVNALYSPSSMPQIQGSLLEASIGSSNLNVVQKLLDAGADVNMVVEGETALCRAVREGDRDALNVLLSHGANPSPLNSKITPLAVAAARGDMGIAQCLIQAGADVDQLSQKPSFDDQDSYFGIATPLWWTLSSLLADIKYDDRFQSKRNHQDVVILLLSCGADPNWELGRPDGLGLAFHEVDGLIVEEFKWGTDSDMPIVSKFPIQFAAEIGNKEMVQSLLAAGADVNPLSRDSESRTVLEHAFRPFYYCDDDEEREEVVNILIKAGAHIRHKGDLLANAMEYGYFDLASDLIKDGVDVNCISENGTRPLPLAVFWGNDDMVQLLLDHGADVNAPTSPTIYDCATALQFAALNGHFNMAKFLIENGADINAPISSSTFRVFKWNSALQVAAGRGKLDIVYLLLENDKDVDMIQSRCKEAAMFAEEVGNNVLARLLQDYSPKRN